MKEITQHTYNKKEAFVKLLSFLSPIESLLSNRASIIIQNNISII
ncbi:hypothetical protein CAPGI0001_1140 [Capnocytophaga gingivalis ATCC 33624]|nr:hypothetical protein CAPGI0001_1140 [Capnocytophaga gingivalis ATCC 33624]